MIDTGASSYQEAIKIGEQFKVQVNERYRLLEIDIDNVFKRLLLHAKKKYAAMNASINKATNEETATLKSKVWICEDVNTVNFLKIFRPLY